MSRLNYLYIQKVNVVCIAFSEQSFLSFRNFLPQSNILNDQILFNVAVNIIDTYSNIKLYLHELNGYYLFTCLSKMAR